jgi:chromosome partitioning protein
MRTIAVVALKGSQTKTTSVVNIAACLAGQGSKVLVLDLDTQANATYVLLRGESPRPPTISEVLTGDVDAESAIVKTGFDGIEMIPAEPGLADVNIAIGSEVGRERRLRAAMATVEKQFDYCLIDTGPTRTLLTTNVLNYAEEVLAPIVPGVFAFLGLAQLQNDISLVKRFLENKALHLTGVFLSMVERTTVAKDFEAGLRDALGDLVFQTTIPRIVKFEEANARRQSIFEHAPDSPGTDAYVALTREVISRGQREEKRDDLADRNSPSDRAGGGSGSRGTRKRRAG